MMFSAGLGLLMGTIVMSNDQSWDATPNTMLWLCNSLISGTATPNTINTDRVLDCAGYSP